MSSEVTQNTGNDAPLKSTVEARAAAAAAREADSHPKSTPPTSAKDTSRDKFSIPGCQSTRPPLLPCFALDFFTPDADHAVRTIIVDPGKLDDFVKAIYLQLEQLCNIRIPISRNDYVRMMKTFILKRVQDIHEKCFIQRAPSFVRIYRNVILPKPIYDLACALGRGFNTHDGFHYYMTPIDKPHTKAPSYWTVDETILANYIKFSRRMANVYQHVEFPSSNDFDGRAIGCTRIEAANGRAKVVSTTPAPTPADGLLRMMNPDDFLAGEVPDVGECTYRLCDEMLLSTVRCAYIGSSVTKITS